MRGRQTVGTEMRWKALLGKFWDGCYELVGISRQWGTQVSTQFPGWRWLWVVPAWGNVCSLSIPCFRPCDLSFSVHLILLFLPQPTKLQSGGSHNLLGKNARSLSVFHLDQWSLNSIFKNMPSWFSISSMSPLPARLGDSYIGVWGWDPWRNSEEIQRDPSWRKTTLTATSK